MKWISVKKRLPKIGVPVWTWSGNYLQIAKRYADSNCWSINQAGSYHPGNPEWDEFVDMDNFEPTHWMPLPATPEEK